MLGNKSFVNGKEIFNYNKFKILYSEGFNSYQLRYGDLSVPDAAGEDIVHLDCMCELLKAKVSFAGLDEKEIDRALSRFKISNFAFKQKEVKVKFA